MCEHRPSEIHAGLYSKDRDSFVGAPEFRGDCHVATHILDQNYDPLCTAPRQPANELLEPRRIDTSPTDVGRVCAGCRGRLHSDKPLTDGGKPTNTQADSNDESSVAETPIWWNDPDPDAERRFVERHGHVNQIAVGTILEYDGWQWALVTEIASDREEPKFGFIPLDQVPDDITKRVEVAHGCRQHYAAVKHLTGGEHEYWVPVDYVLTDDVWEVLGPIHPDYREGDGDGDGDDDSDQEVRCDGGDPPEQDDTDTQTVDIVGPTRSRYELTDEELERVKESDSPIFEIDQEPVEWEPASGEWEVNDG